MRRTLVLVLGAILAGLASAEPLVSTIRLQGGKVGQNIFEQRADGTFSSVTEIKVGTATVASKLVGKRTADRLTEFSFTLSQGPLNLSGEYREGKLSATNNGEAILEDVAIDLAKVPYLSGLHPQVVGSLVARHLAKPGEKKLSVFSFENLSVLQAEIVASSDRKVVVGGRAVAATSLRLNVANVVVEVVGSAEKVYGFTVPSQQLTIELDGTTGVFDDPLAKYPELSQPRYKTKMLEAVPAKLPDGTTLVADIAMPKTEGKWPVILIRTCYGRGLSMLQAEFFASRGYVLMAQDVRGRGDSEGEFDPLVTEAADGKATLDWIVAQPWSNGRVGMIGASYLGFVQWAAASTGHPALKCIVPQVSPPDPTRNFPWDHGMFMLAGSLWWARIGGDRSGDVANALAELTGMRKMETLPLTKVDDEFLGKNVPWFDKWLARDSLDKWKGSFRLDDVAKVKVPVLHVSGFWDGDGIGTKLHWEALRAAGRKDQWLVFGPWNHAFNTSNSMGDVSYGPDAILELDSLYLRFFDHYLKMREGFMAGQPRVKFFVSGANRWLEVPDWPPPGSSQRTWYLSGGSARGLDGGGKLVPAKQSAPPAKMAYDPTGLKVETDKMAVELTQSLVLKRKDLESPSALVFRTEAFDRPTKLSGPATFKLFVSTSGRDAGFFVSLAEQRADGTVRAICLPGKSRIGWKENGTWGPVKPGEVVKLTIKPWEFAHEFPKGSRLVAIVSCDGFPGFARIPGTGESEATATKLVKTTQSLYRSGARASELSVTVLPD